MTTFKKYTLTNNNEFAIIKFALITSKINDRPSLIVKKLCCRQCHFDLALSYAINTNIKF